MSVETVIAVLVPLAALAFTALSYRRNEHQDTSAAATERATLTADVKYIRASVDEIKVENRTIRQDVTNLQTKLAQVEASTESAHKRIDDLQKG